MLTTTRSLSDVKNEPSPYRMSGQGLLPKFGPRKKGREVGDPAPQIGGEKAEAKDNLGEGKGDRTDAGCSLKLESNRKPKGLLAWLLGLFARRTRRQRRESVQTEFALDLVKVVRNDLSEVEAEAEARASKRANKTEKSAPEREQQPEETVFGAPVR